MRLPGLTNWVTWRMNFTWRTPTDRPPSVRTTGKPMFTLTLLASLGAQEKTNCTSMLWSIDSCQNKVSADQYHLTVSRAQVSTHRGQVFFEVIRWQVTSFQMIAGSSLIFLIHMKYVVFYMCRTIKILISNWPRKLKFSQFLQAGKTCQLLLTFLTKVTRWSRSTSNFYTLIGQNLTDEFMRKIYAASWNLLTLTAEADRVLCQFKMFLSVFFHWMYKMKYSCYQESYVIHG